MTINTTPTSCQTNIRVEEKDKARNEAINRMIMEHAEEVVLMQEYADHYRNICAGLVLSLVLVLAGTWYCLYYLDKPCEPVQVAKVIKAEKVKRGGEQYVLVP